MHIITGFSCALAGVLAVKLEVILEQFVVAGGVEEDAD
jgi:hypothetical protein